MAADSRSLRVALVQLKVTNNKEENVRNARKRIEEAAENGAKLVSLPECFNSPYGTQFFAEYAETIPGETTNMLSHIAKDLKIHLVGGSIPESCDGKLYNTAAIFGPDGTMVAKFRKIHPADVNVPGRLTFTESDAITPGDEPAIFEIGCNLIMYPGLFNKITGPEHWKSLLTARAIDNQLYVAGCSAAQDENAFYGPWGHSTVIDPWGNIVVAADEEEGIVYADIDIDFVDKIRKQIPIHYQKRKDVYGI